MRVREGFVRGSSPLTRGKHQAEGCLGGVLRLIPAHAGKTERPTSHSMCRAAHPRSRGENRDWQDVQNGLNGSSPLTRGKHALSPITARFPRLIPAHAGKTGAGVGYLWASAAHPRSRGENWETLILDEASGGSSPLTRGKRALDHFRERVERLIPAHAGKTASASQPSSSCAAHPRSRGENDRAVGHADRGEGSSPLTRGKLPPGQDQAVVDRLIPAHAGKTGCESVLRGAHEAHPRSRGENATNEDPASAYSGSSPLTRGKRSRVPSRFPRPRLIPAHAGKTYLLHRLLSLVRAHPRSRGENRPIPRAAPWTTGSSPLTRGKLGGDRRRRRGVRLIPAHAGKTR